MSAHRSHAGQICMWGSHIEFSDHGYLPKNFRWSTTICFGLDQIILTNHPGNMHNIYIKANLKPNKMWAMSVPSRQLILVSYILQQYWLNMSQKPQVKKNTFVILDTRRRSESRRYRHTKWCVSGFMNKCKQSAHTGQSKHLKSDPNLRKSLPDMPRQSMLSCCQRRYQLGVWGESRAGDGTRGGIQTLPDKTTWKRPGSCFFFFFLLNASPLFPLPTPQTAALSGHNVRLLTSCALA